MERVKAHCFRMGMLLGAVLGALLAVSLACAAPQPTATSASPAPATALTPTATPIAPTPTRALPTSTPVVAAKPVYGGTLRYAADNPGKIDTLDAHYTIQHTTYPSLRAIYDLLVLEDQGQLVPELAESWEASPDGMEISFRLVKGAKFQDGTPFDAEAVKWNFDRMMDPKGGSPRRVEIIGSIKAVEVVDQNTAKVRLNRPFRPLLALLTDRAGWMVSPAAVKKYGVDYGRNPVGTGPFKLKEWRVDERMILERNGSYWQPGKPYLDQIALLNVPDGSVRLAMLRTGELDVSTSVSPQQLALIEGNPNLTVGRFLNTGFKGLHLNGSKPPFDNQALRQALAYAHDRDPIIQVIYRGNATPAYTMIGGGWAYNPDLKPMQYDLEKAKQKLVEAGYAKGIALPIGCQASAAYLQECEVYQAMYAKVGINLQIVPIPTEIFYVATQGYLAEPGMGPINWSFRPDPHFLLSILVHKDGSWNAGRHINAERDRLIEEATAIYDLAKARPLYDKIQTIVAEEAIFIFTVRTYDYKPMSKKVKDIPLEPAKGERLRFVWLEK